MKKTLLCISLLSAVALSSCGLLDLINASSLVDQEVAAYDLTTADRNNPESPKIQNAYKNPVHFSKSDEFVPYVSLSEYANMLARLFDKTASTKFSRSGHSTVWQVYSGDTYIFYAIHDPSRKEILIGGSLYSAFTKNMSDSKNSSISALASSKQDIKNEGENYTTYSYASLETQQIYSGGTYYLPLAYWDASIGQTCDTYHFFDMSRIFIYSEYEQLTKQSFYNGTAIVPYENTAYYYQSSIFGMPLSLRKLDRDTAYLVFETRYGLKKYKGIPSMISYFDDSGTGRDMISDSASTRTRGFSKLFYSLDELHTTPYSLASWWGDDVNDFIFSPKYEDYGQKRKQYVASRKEKAQEKYRYYEDKKTAIIEVNDFTATFSAYKEDGSLVDNIADLDSFFYLAKNLDRAKSAGAKTVVLDLTTNPGGYVYVMQKMVALLSKTNNIRFSSYSDSLKYDYDVIMSIDTNGDGEYDEKDVYGNDFNFYIMTSSISFSAGNAFPFFSRCYGFAKTIGVNSGGGECSTERVMLPSGRGFNFSVDNHIVYRDGTTIRHSENGAGIDIALSDTDFYDDAKVLAAIG